MTNKPVFLFSRHAATPEMISAVGKITQQFEGNIFDPIRVKDMVKFTIEKEKIAHFIPAQSIVIAVAPLPLQQQWLTALGEDGVFLVPQDNRIVLEDQSVLFQFAGLLWVKRIEIVTEQWSGLSPTLEDKAKQRALLI
jgi:hypothetical protein